MEELNENIETLTETEKIIENESELKSESYEDTVIKDYFLKETGLTSKEMAILFGQSEEEISKEFGVYKAKKLYQKMDYLIIDSGLTQTEFSKKCQISEKHGFKSVTVLPTFVGLAKDLLGIKNISVRALISYPFGEDLPKVKYYAVKNSLKLGADAFLVCVSTSQVKSGDYKGVCKEFKRIIKICKKKPVTAVLDESKLSQLEIEKCAKILSKETKIHSVMPADLIESSKFNAQTVKSVLLAVDGKCHVESGGKIQSAMDTVAVLNAGANAITSSKCPEIAEELNMKIMSGV